MRVQLTALAVAAGATAFITHMARADSVADFYKGKTVEMQIGYSAGGGYDVYARTVAQYLADHIPGKPTVIAKNAPGAGSLKLTNWLYSAAPKDGTVIGAVGRGAAFEPLIGNTKAQFDATKFNWLGSANNEVSVCVAWHTSGVKTFEDTLTKELVVGGTGPSADTDVFPQVIAAVFGAKLKLVTGYPGGNDINLAMERGEVTGRCGWSWSSVKSTRGHWLSEKKISVFVQLAMKKHADLPKIPLIMDMAKSREQTQMLRLVFARQSMGRPYLLPPGVPADRVAALRKAFDDTMKDKAFLAEVQKRDLELDPVTGSEIQDLVKEAIATDKAVVDKVAAILSKAKGSGKKGKAKKQ
ncbi:MAG: Bug family tripartite tricarboxylate transporter substrate binding protein [Hyphomicrobiaceae bacterium]